MIDHIYLPVSDLERSSGGFFTRRCLSRLASTCPTSSIKPPSTVSPSITFRVSRLKNGEVAKDLYVAFTAKSADAVRACYKAATTRELLPTRNRAFRPEWRADYFAANIGDPDRYNALAIAYKPLALQIKVRAPSTHLRPADAGRLEQRSTS